MPLNHSVISLSPSRQSKRVLLGFCVTASLMIALGARNASAIVLMSDDFVDYIEAQRDDVAALFGTGSGNYIAPSPLERADFSTLATSLFTGNLGAADAQAAAIQYDLIQFTDTVSGDIYYGLAEQGVPTRGWGTYFFNFSPSASTLIEVPHPVFDTRSWEIGALTFRQSESTAFLMAGAHRNANGIGTADAAHLTDSIFQEVHEAWNGVAGQNTTWSIHGFDDGNHTFPAGTDAVLSNGDGSVSAEVVAIDAEFEGQGFETYAYNTLPPLDPLNVTVNGVEDGADFASLGGTTNVQGIYSRGIGGIFIQIEMEQSIRFDANNRQLAADALSAAITSTNAINNGVPEPSSWLLLLLGVAVIRRKRKHYPRR